MDDFLTLLSKSVHLDIYNLIVYKFGMRIERFVCVMKNLLTTIAMTTVLSAFAEKPWTMEECMAFAATHASSVAQAQWDA